MQTNGIGSSHSDMHHVTNCIHNHKHRLEGKVGGAGGAGSAKANTTPAAAASAQQTMPTFSLSAWLQDTLSGAGRLFGKIWGSDAEVSQGEFIAKTGVETVTDTLTQSEATTQLSVLDIQSGLQQDLQQHLHQNLQQDLQQTAGADTLHTSQIEAASAAVQPPQNFNNNPYFTAMQENETPRQTIWQRIKVRFQNITGFLAKRFSFAGGGTFQTKQERPKEDLSRHSRYRKDDLEIDCVLTDESYLMDSYNKKGEYSKLSAGK